jgi:hypothetical protein
VCPILKIFDSLILISKGSALHYGYDPLSFLKSTQQNVGDIFTLFMAGKPVTIVLDGKAISSLEFEYCKLK